MLNINAPENTWQNRRKSWLIKCCMKHARFKPKDIAKYIGSSASYVNTKLQRDRWSFEDILIALEASGLKMAIIDTNGEQHEVCFKDWFEDTDPEVLDRFKAIEREEMEQILAIIGQKQSEIESLKNKYGIK